MEFHLNTYIKVLYRARIDYYYYYPRSIKISTFIYLFK